MEKSATDPASVSTNPFADLEQAVGAHAEAGPIERAFFSHAGRIVLKWYHYLPLYDRYFHPFQHLGRPVRLLEIGVFGGGSLELWRQFFGTEAEIVGVDTDPACAALDGENGNRVRIGSQSDPEFLRAVVREMGGLDIVIDDGSHVASHQRASFETLFPLLEDGGLYVVEDLHTSYWTEYEGGYASQTSAVALCKTLIDDMHHWYHRRGQALAAASGHVVGLHVHDSIAFIEKNRAERPMHGMRGVPSPQEAAAFAMSLGRQRMQDRKRREAAEGDGVRRSESSPER